MKLPPSSTIISSFRFSLPLLVGLLTFFTLFSFPERILFDADSYWHIAAGRWIIEHLSIPSTDPFSHSMPNAPWTAHEWLAEVLLAVAYRIGGWGGVVLLTSGVYLVTMMLLTRYLLRYLEPVRVFIVVAMAFFMAQPHILARPHALILPIMVFWVISLASSCEARRTPPFWTLILIVLWANLHGSFPLALVFALTFAVEAVITADTELRWLAMKQWGIFVAATLVATVLTPHGIDGWRFVADVHAMDFSLSTIGEWRSPDFRHLQPLEIWLLFGAGIILVKGLSLPPTRVVLLLALLHLALKYVRHNELLGLVAPIIVAQPFGTQLSLMAKSSEQAEGLDLFFAKLARPSGKAAIIVALGMICIATFLSSNDPSVKPAPRVSPVAALQAARDASAIGLVLNAYDFGGYLIFSGVPPFIDGRADLYGDVFFKQYYDAVYSEKKQPLIDLLDQHKIDWTLLQPNMNAVTVLDQLPGWQRIYADKIAVVHIRQK
jgi:hypothetical protein